MVKAFLKHTLALLIVSSTMMLNTNIAYTQGNDESAATSTCFTVGGCDGDNDSAATSTCMTIDGCIEEHNTKKTKPPKNVKAKKYKCKKEKDEREVKSTFEVCNDESETIRITKFTALYPFENFAELVTPILPVTINPDTCLVFEIKPNKDNAFKCGGFADVLLRVESETPDGPIRGNIAIGL